MMSEMVREKGFQNARTSEMAGPGKHSGSDKDVDREGHQGLWVFSSTRACRVMQTKSNQTTVP